MKSRYTFPKHHNFMKPSGPAIICFKGSFYDLPVVSTIVRFDVCTINSLD